MLDVAAGIDLANCTTPNGLPCESAALRPDNAPICPVIDSTSRFSFVTLRGGGLFVVDSSVTPMRIVAEYDRATVHPNGCLGAEVPGKMYVDSGGGTPTNVFEADLYAFPVTGFSPLNPPNTPAPAVIFSEDVEGADTHGATLTKHGRYVLSQAERAGGAAAQSIAVWNRVNQSAADYGERHMGPRYRRVRSPNRSSRRSRSCLPARGRWR